MTPLRARMIRDMPLQRLSPRLLAALRASWTLERPPRGSFQGRTSPTRCLLGRPNGSTTTPSRQPASRTAKVSIPCAMALPPLSSKREVTRAPSSCSWDTGRSLPPHAPCASAARTSPTSVAPALSCVSTPCRPLQRRRAMSPIRPNCHPAAGRTAGGAHRRELKVFSLVKPPPIPHATCLAGHGLVRCSSHTRMVDS